MELKFVHYFKNVWVDEIVRACPDCTAIHFTGEKWRRFAAKKSDKGTALQILAEHMGVDLQDVIAFGDDINDLDMLVYAGLSVAVSNAVDEVKAVADHIADSNDEDGVARFLEMTILSDDPLR